MNKIAHYQSLELEKVESLFRNWTAGRTTPLKVLDFGCGRGKFLRLFAALGCDVVGVDANRDYVQEGNVAGFTIFHATDFAAAKDAFDIVFLSHVIEHIAPESLVNLITLLCDALRADGKLIIITPVLGERFYYDFSHMRPFYPQSIRHAFGQIEAPLSFGALRLINLIDVYFFRDPFRPRTWRSYYFAHGIKKLAVNVVNGCSDLAWRLTGGRIGALASWLGVYEKLPK